MRIDFELNIENMNDRMYINEFFEELLNDIRNQIMINIDSKILYDYKDILLNSNNIKWINKPNDLNMIMIFKLINNSLKYKNIRNNEYSIYLDRSIRMPNTRTSIANIARIIDKGNENYNPTWFISKTLNKYKRNINKYWKSFISIKTKSLSTKRTIKIR